MRTARKNVCVIHNVVFFGMDKKFRSKIGGF